jgi:hypothetical protein
MNRRMLFSISGGLLLSLSTLAYGVKVKSAKKRPPSVIGQAAKKRVKYLPKIKPLGAQQALPFSGIVLEMEKADRYPAYRISLPNNSVPAGVTDSWMEFIPDELKSNGSDGDSSQSGVTNDNDADHASGDAESGKEKDADDSATSLKRHQRVPLPPGSYDIHFSSPIPTTTLVDYSIPLMWTVSAKVKKGKATTVSVNPPNITPDRIAHVDFIPSGSHEPFNSFSIELTSTDHKDEKLTGRWDYIAPNEGWALSIPLTLIKGEYRVTLAASSFGAFDTLRYEFPDPLKVESSGQLILPFPKFHRLQADISDRKGVPLLGIPLIFKGKGNTTAMADTRGGRISMMLPEGDYEVKALVFNDKGDQVEKTLEDKLDMSEDRTKSWKAPMTAIDFGIRRTSDSH